MAKTATCEYCRKYGLVDMRFGISYCPDCLNAIKDKDTAYFKRIGGSKATARAKKDVDDALQDPEERQRQLIRKQEEISENKRNMIISSCQSIDGYRATKQLGMVFGECVFKSGFFNRVFASIENLDALVSFGDQELGGSTQLMDSARNYAMNKMINHAAQKGANAILGVDAESSVGGEIVHVMIYGTAVRVEPISE